MRRQQPSHQWGVLLATDSGPKGNCFGPSLGCSSDGELTHCISLASLRVPSAFKAGGRDGWRGGVSIRQGGIAEGEMSDFRLRFYIKVRTACSHNWKSGEKGRWSTFCCPDQCASRRRAVVVGEKPRTKKKVNINGLRGVIAPTLWWEHDSDAEPQKIDSPATCPDTTPKMCWKTC